MLPLTCCYKHKKNNDCQQKAAHDCGSSILSLLTRCGSVCQEEQTTPKYICLPYPVSNLFRFFWSALIGRQTTTSLAAGNNRLTQKRKINKLASSNEGLLPPKLSLEFYCLPMPFLMFSPAFLMLQTVFNVFSVMFAKTPLLFCCFCIRVFVSNSDICLVPYGVIRNFDAIIHVSNYAR